MKAKKFLQIILIVFPMTLMGCNKKGVCPDSVQGTIIRYSLDGCSWMIELNDSVRLEPINLKDFNIEIKDGKKIWITYELATNRKTICMAGKMVKINCIEER